MSDSDTLAQFVGRRIAWIQQAYRDPGRSDGAAFLAELRKSGPQPGSYPATWALEFEGFPESLIGVTDSPSWGERAAHLAFTLYAIHQQSQTEPMHQAGREHSFGSAVARLSAEPREGSDAMPFGKLPTRFAALGTASTFDEVGHYARQLVTQLRSAAIPLDYGRLARQLYQWQMPAGADAVRLQWGREFAGASTLTTDTSTTPDQKEC